MNPHEVQGLSQEVVAQGFEEPLHQGHGETVDTRPRGGVQGLPRGAGRLRHKQQAGSRPGPKNQLTGTLGLPCNPAAKEARLLQGEKLLEGAPAGSEGGPRSGVRRKEHQMEIREAKAPGSGWALTV